MTDSKMARKQVVSRLARAFQKNWPELENRLLSIEAEPEFPKFLENYRGHSNQHFAPQTTARQNELRSAMGGAFVDHFAEIINTAKVKTLLRTLSEADVAAALLEFEELVNLALYYWHGAGDRNFQFRTVVHFCDLEGNGACLFKVAGQDWYVSFSEHGFRLGSGDDAHIPRTTPLLNAFGLNEFRAEVLQKSSPQILRKLFARVRTLQREVCLLEEEWEHRNSLLAVEHAEFQHAFRKHENEETKAALDDHTNKLSVFRNHFAEWVVKTFIGLQAFSADLMPFCNQHTDLAAEFDALDAVIHSGIQKIFLPASVSRHRYNRAIAELLLVWTHERLRLHTDDLATILVRDALHLHLGITESPLEAPDLLNKKSYEWTLSCDPCNGLKAFCWNLPPHAHKTLTALATIAIARKTQPNPMQEYWVHCLASLADMPDSFPDKEKIEPIVIPESRFKNAQTLSEIALEIIKKTPMEIKEDESKTFLVNYFAQTQGAPS
jgi:hypothetical protein